MLQDKGRCRFWVLLAQRRRVPRTAQPEHCRACSWAGAPWRYLCYCRGGPGLALPAGREALGSARLQPGPAEASRPLERCGRPRLFIFASLSQSKR